MRVSSVLAFVVTCVVLLIGVTRARRWDEQSTGEGFRQKGEYSLTVGKGLRKRARLQSTRSMSQLGKVVSRQLYPWREISEMQVSDSDSCEDHAPRLCQRFMGLYGSKIKTNCERLPGFLRKRVMRKCQKTCGLCENEEKPDVNVFRVIRRRRLPYPQIGGFPQYGSQSGSERPKKGTYFIYTRRIAP